MRRISVKLRDFVQFLNLTVHHKTKYISVIFKPSASRVPNHAPSR